MLDDNFELNCIAILTEESFSLKKVFFIEKRFFIAFCCQDIFAASDRYKLFLFYFLFNFRKYFLLMYCLTLK